MLEVLASALLFAIAVGFFVLARRHGSANPPHRFAISKMGIGTRTAIILGVLALLFAYFSYR
jgi:hypothetical protein